MFSFVNCLIYFIHRTDFASKYLEARQAADSTLVYS